MKKTNTSSCDRKCLLPLWAKILLGVVLGVAIAYGLLIAFNIADFKNLTSTTTTTKELPSSGEHSDLSSIPLSTMTTKQAIETYLAEANKEIKADQVVASGDQITVDYIGRLSEDEVFDTSVKAVAEAAGKFTPQRNYDEGLSFTVGAKQMIQGFDEAVVGMKVGETKTVHIPAEKAYGQKNEEMIVRVPLEQAGDTSGATVGMKVVLGGMYPATITEITDKEIVFDANPELAGKDLIFDITIKAIQPKA